MAIFDNAFIISVVAKFDQKPNWTLPNSFHQIFSLRKFSCIVPIFERAEIEKRHAIVCSIEPFSGVRLKTAWAIKVSFSLVSVVGFFLLVFSLSTEYSQWYISPKNCDLMGFFSLWGGQHLWAVCAKHMLGGKKAQMFEQINENIVCERNKSHAEIHILIPNWWLLVPQNSHRKKNDCQFRNALFISSVFFFFILFIVLLIHTLIPRNHAQQKYSWYIVCFCSHFHFSNWMANESKWPKITTSLFVCVYLPKSVI